MTRWLIIRILWLSGISGHSTVTISAHCHKSVTVLIWPYRLLGIKPERNKPLSLSSHCLQSSNWYQYQCLYMTTEQLHIDQLQNELCLFSVVFNIAMLFQLYHDGDMIYEVRRRKLEPTVLLHQGIFTPPPHTHAPHRHGMRGTGLWWCCKLYTVGKSTVTQLNDIALAWFVPLSPGSPSQCRNQLNYLPTSFSTVTPHVLMWEAQ